MAALPIQRKSDVGAKVPCWKTVGVALEMVWPTALRSSYQRMPVTLFVATAWLMRSVS
jgi:hypothetical protein